MTVESSSDLEYCRVLLKVSGESLKGDREFGVDPDALKYMASEVGSAVALGVQLAVVVGGGNIWRGTEAELEGMDRATADYAGMLATVISSLALQEALERAGVDTRTQSAISISQVAEPYIRRRAIRHLEKGRVVLFAAGTGNPFVTTDTGAALRALEIGAGVVLMAKHKVDGIYDDDPNVNPHAKKLDRVTHEEALQKHIRIMDSTAMSLCMEHDMPIIVFDFFTSGNLCRVVQGEELGSHVSSGKR